MNRQEVLEESGQVNERPHSHAHLLAVSAHELKTPLAIVSGYVELVLTDKLGSLTKLQRQVLEDCERNCARLQRFIGNFLTYAQQEEDKIEVEYDLGDLVECLSDVYHLCLPQFQEKGVAFNFQASQVAPRFPFDYFKVQRVIIALLENALKFTPPQGSVWLTVEPCNWEPGTTLPSNPPKEERLCRKGATNFIRVGVADTGPGIAPEHQKIIFDAFVKIRQPGQPGEGSGLGLAIARQLAEAHGGKVWVESEPGVGSKFFFLLPMTPPGNPIASRDNE
ncbi:MAG TPA: HAMP domain-containing sensor histidine kinase [Terriglobia bacterium]|nr:HAMP domain-containing sensor histidine kinase [Terriglobia bacterium]